MKVASQPVVAKCQTCGGSGQAALGDVLSLTLQVLRASGRPLTPFEVHGRISQDQGAGVGITAINQRLERLRHMGLVDRQRNGHEWVYSAVKKK